MSEGSKFSYKIEFEADEDSLITTVSKAIKRVRPDVDSKLNELVTKSLAKSIRKAIKKTGPIQLEVEVASDYRRSVQREAMRDAPVPSQPDTVGDLLKQTASLMERTGADWVSPVISSTIGMLISRVMEYFKDDPVNATRLLGSATSEITTRGGRYGDLSKTLSSLDELTKTWESRKERGVEMDLPTDIKEQLIELMGKEMGMDIVAQQIGMDQPDSIVQTMTVAKLLSIMGIEPDTTVDIGDILRTEIAVALGEGGVTIAQFEPIVEEREQKQFDRVIEFLRKEIEPHLTSIVSGARAQLGEEFRINIGRIVEVFMKTYGGIVPDAFSDATEIGGASVMPSPEFFGRADKPRGSEGSGVDPSKIIEALNKVVDALYTVGERRAAEEVGYVVGDLTSRMRDHMHSGDSD